MRSPFLHPIASHPSLQEPLRRLVRATLSGALRLRARSFDLGPEGRLLAIAPHPDDACLGCGGLILQRRLEGLPVSILYLTGGGASHPGHPRLSPEDVVEIRRGEAYRAATRLGVDRACIHFAGLVDGTLDKMHGAERAHAIETVRALIAEIGPGHIVLPSRRDGSTEHEGAFVLVRAAAEATGRRMRLLEYPVWAWWSPGRLWTLLWRARRIWRIEFSGYEAVKRQALAAHSSQMVPTPPWTAAVLPGGFAESFCGGEEFLFEMDRT